MKLHIEEIGKDHYAVSHNGIESASFNPTEIMAIVAAYMMGAKDPVEVVNKMSNAQMAQAVKAIVS
jgi:hypothetical protein